MAREDATGDYQIELENGEVREVPHTRIRSTFLVAGHHLTPPGASAVGGKKPILDITGYNRRYKSPRIQARAQEAAELKRRLEKVRTTYHKDQPKRTGWGSINVEDACWERGNIKRSQVNKTTRHRGRSRRN